MSKILKKNSSWLSSVNIMLGMLIILAVGYISYIATTSTRPVKVPGSVLEAKLILNLSPGTSTADITSDIALVNATLRQEKKDRSVANGVYATVSSKSTSLSKRLKLLSTVKNESTAFTQLSALQDNTLLAKINSLNAGDLTIGGYSNTLSELVIMVAYLKVSDDQLVAEGLLSQLGGVFSTAIKKSSIQGVPATNLEADLTTLRGDVSASKTISGVAFNQLFSGKYLVNSTQIMLSTSERDIEAAINAATTIANDLNNS